MNTSIAFLENWPLPAVLALEAAALVGIAGVIQRWVQNAWWRRTLWQTCMLALLEPGSGPRHRGGPNGCGLGSRAGQRQATG
jgi:hypothetical protein